MAQQQREQFQNDLEEQNRRLRIEYLFTIAETKASQLRSRVAAGEVSFLYDTIYLPVDSVLMEENFVDDFQLGTLRRLGLDGWEVVGVVPRTVGVGLTNITHGLPDAQTWGGGIGGNVAGVHLVLKKAVNLNNLTDEMLTDYVFNHLTEILTPEETQAVAEALPE